MALGNIEDMMRLVLEEVAALREDQRDLRRTDGVRGIYLHIEGRRLRQL